MKSSKLLSIHFSISQWKISTGDRECKNQVAFLLYPLDYNINTTNGVNFYPTNNHFPSGLTTILQKNIDLLTNNYNKLLKSFKNLKGDSEAVNKVSVKYLRLLQMAKDVDLKVKFSYLYSCVNFLGNFRHQMVIYMVIGIGRMEIHIIFISHFL